MGSSQSTPAPEVEKELLARVEALNLASKTDLEKGYVVVSEKAHTLRPSENQSKRTTQVSISIAEEWERKLLADPKNRLALSALSSNDATSIITSRATKIADEQIFNLKIPFEGAPITNQRSSGRCWLFASTNVFRVAVMRKYKLESFELSQAYLFFWDKLEKANYFLESVLETADEELDSRLVVELLKSPVGDGGQWDMVANLVKKYGLVPQSLYPDSYNAMNSSTMGRLLTSKLREHALILRHLVATSSSSIPAAKAKMLQEIHLILTLMLGPPPAPKKEFTWEYYDSDSKFHRVMTTPVDFASSLSSPAAVRANAGSDVNSLFSLVNDPRNEYSKLLTVDRLGNVREGRPITYVNVPVATLKAAAIAMIRAGLPVFFGCDVGKYSSSASGIMDTALFDYEIAFNVRLGMDKSSRLRTGESAMTHAMVLTGVHVDDGKPVRWRVQNSWGESAGDKGWFVMSDEWFGEFVYQVVVDPRYVGKDIRDVLKQDPIVLPLWDPMGALA